MQRHGCCVRAARSDVRAARVAAALWRCAGVCKAKFFLGGGGAWRQCAAACSDVKTA